MPSWALAPPLLWGPEISWEEGKWGRADWSHVGLPLPTAPQVTPGLCPQMCPQQPQEPRELFLLLPKSRHTSLHPNNYLNLGALPSSQEPPPAAESPQQWGSRACWCQSALFITQAVGQEGGEAAPLLKTSPVRCCSVHSPQGNQTLWIFWSFVVKLFPNSNRFKCHHTNGREKPFMQLQSGFLRWLGY